MKQGTRSKQIVLLLTLMSVFVLLGNAQTGLIYYHTKNQFNSSNYNPAFLTAMQKFTFSIFPLAGMGVGYNNQEVIMDVMTRSLNGNQTNEDFKDIFNSLVEQELFFLNYETNLLHLGYNSDIGSFNFRIKENVLLATDFKGELSDFLMSPTFSTLAIGRPQLFAAEALHYREYSLGFARELIRNKLTVGLRTKLYLGKSILVSNVLGVMRPTDNTYSLQIEGPMKLSIPANPTFQNDVIEDLNLAKDFDIVNYVTNTANFGAGIDLGFTYKITPEIELSASVTDWGKINWKKNINTLLFNDEFVVPEENIEIELNENGEPVLTKIIEKPISDSINFSLKIDRTPFSTPLPATFFAGLKYQLNPKLNVGIVERYISTKGLNHNSISLTANYQANKKLTIITGYSIIENSYNNIPLALLYKWDGGQTFFGTDNLLSLLFPSSSEFSGITFGTCFYLFRNKVKYEEPLDYRPFFRPKKLKERNKKGLIFNNYIDSKS